MRKKNRGAAAAIGTVLLFAFASVAVAAIKTEKETFSLGFGQSVTLAPTCEGGSQVVSGGFDAPGFDPVGTEDHYIQPFTSAPSNASTWASQGRNGNPVAGDFIAYAYCSDVLDPLVQNSEFALLPAGERGTADASCPENGQDAISGGFGPAENFEDDLVYPYESRRLDSNTWRIAAWNSDDESRDLEAHVVCTSENLKLSVGKDSSKQKTDKVVSAKAKCDKGEAAISGGFDGLNTDERQTFLFQSKRKGKKSWVAGAGAYTDDAKAKWKAYVYCVKANKVD